MLIKKYATSLYVVRHINELHNKDMTRHDQLYKKNFSICVE